MIFQNIIINAYKKELLHRYDPDGSVFYYSAMDFPTLSVRDFEFSGQNGQKLKGHFYTDECNIHPEMLVIFEHGMGCGHAAYMREIATIAKKGYTVFAYDHTGTLDSEGEHIGGFTQSLVDLDYAITALKASGEVDGKKIAVIGHSWGGYSSLNIGAFHPDISHIVTLAGFVSVKKMIRTALGKLRTYTEAVFETEVNAFGAYALADATLSLRQYRGKVLVVHSDDDNTVPCSHFEEMRVALSDRENIRFLLMTGKKHNPNFTVAAAEYKDNFFTVLTKAKKQKKLKTTADRKAFSEIWDFDKMTEQDAEFWDTVFKFFEE